MMDDATIAQCKWKLENVGFVVIPKDRVIRLEQNYHVSGWALAELDHSRDWRATVHRNMGMAIGRKLVEDRLCVLSERVPENFDGKLYTMETRVILPKPEGT